MKTRVITAAALVPVLVLILLICPAWATAWALALMLAIAAYELLHSTGLVRHKRMIAYSMVAAFAFPLCCYYSIGYGWTVLALLCYAALLFGEVMLSHTEVPFEKIAISLVAGLLIPAALSAIVRIRMMDGVFGKCMVTIPFVLAFLPDSGAYFAGRFFGKHKLAPIISPKKTVEGAIGGVLSGMLFMVIYALIVHNAFDFKVNYLVALVYGFVGALGAIFGDLCLSVIKRQTNIKDYGNLFPGHGGILDRFDSVIVTAPLTEILLDLLPVVV